MGERRHSADDCGHAEGGREPPVVDYARSLVDYAGSADDNAGSAGDDVRSLVDYAGSVDNSVRAVDDYARSADDYARSADDYAGSFEVDVHARARFAQVIEARARIAMRAHVCRRACTYGDARARMPSRVRVSRVSSSCFFTL